MSWLSGWKYRKQHIITTASGAGTNYQIRFKVHYGSGTDSGEDVYLNNKCKSDFGDIRFTEDDGMTLLSYWIEDKTDNSEAIFWTKITDDLGNDDVSIYIYYGNNNVSTTSSGDGTFIDFWDFNDGNVPSNFGNYGGSSPVVDSAVTYEGSYSLKKPDQYGIICGLGSLYSSGCVELRCKVDPIQDYRFYWGAGTGSSWGGTQAWVTMTNLVSGWNKVRVYWYDNQRKVDANSSTFSTTSTSTPGQILGPYANSLNDIWWDNSFFRKYVSPEPSHGSWGVEEVYYLGYFSGYVYELGNPVSRKIYLHNRDTGELIGSTTSSGNGYYYIETTYSGAHYIVCLDALAEPDFNDLIIGNVYPTTISGQ